MRKAWDCWHSFVKILHLEKFGVCLKGDADPRYFTTQADATHFSGCKGKIVSCNGLYEGMMDDAINVHGTYLKVVKRVDDRTLVGRYMHGQSGDSSGDARVMRCSLSVRIRWNWSENRIRSFLSVLMTKNRPKARESS